MAHGDESSDGSFGQDRDWVLREMSKPPIIQLGKPIPDSKFLPLRRAAKCPATHNRLLFEGAEADRRLFSAQANRAFAHRPGR